MKQRSPNNRILALLAGLMAIGLIVGLVGNASAAPLVVDFKQAANNDSPLALGDAHWIGSIIQSSNARYFEGMDVPQRTVFTNVPTTTGNVHTLTFSHQFTKAGIHAYDWLTSYPQAVADAAGAGTAFINVSGGTFTNAEVASDEIGPPADLGATVLGILNTGPYTDIPVPDDPYVSKDGSTQAKINAYEVVRGNRTIRIYAKSGSPISASSLTVAHDVANGADTGDSFAQYTLTWTSNSDQFVIEMAGHLAVSGDGTGFSWGAGLGSSQISGGPYHFKLDQLDGGSLGSQDNQIKGADIQIPTGSITVIKDTVPNGPTDFGYTTTGGLTPSTFSLDDDADPTLSNTRVFSNLAAGTYTVTEAAVAGFDLTSITGATSFDLPTRTASVTLAFGGSATVIFTNTQKGKIIVDKVTAPTGSLVSFVFTPTGTGYTTPFNLADATTPNDSGWLVPGNYTVTETVPDGWTLTNTNVLIDVV